MNDCERSGQNRQEKQANQQESNQVDPGSFLEYSQFQADRAKENITKSENAADKKRKEDLSKQFSGVSGLLSGIYRKGGVNTLDELKSALGAHLESLIQDEETADESEHKQFERERKKAEDSLRLLDNFDPHYLEHAPFKEWKKEKNIESTQERQVVAQAESVKTEQEIKENRLMLEILTEGGVGVHTSLPKEYHPNHSAGFTNIIDNRLIPGAPGQFSSGDIRGFFGIGGFGNDLSRKYEEAHVREFVSFIPVETDVYQEGEVPVQEKRFLGSKTVMKKQMQKVGVRPVLHGESVSNGTKEPLVKLRYFADAGKNEDASLWYKDYTGRGGNIIAMEVLLPQSVAEKVKQEVKSNPVFVRKVVKELMTNKLGIPEKVWQDGNEKTNGHSICPPYEKWDAAGESMYFKEPNDDYSFKPERVIKVQPKKK